jgi:phosphatidylglycerol:prolipoprotein diacylglycerol transferase
LALADLVAPGVLLGMGLGRIGCFFTGCCYGDTCQLPWAVTFPWGTPPHVEQALDGQLHLEGLVFRGVEDAPPILERVEPGSPAARGGLKTGDQIDAVLLPTKEGTKTIEVETVKGAVNALEQLREGQQVALLVGGSREVKAWTLAGESRSLRVHPAQIYSAVDSLLLCLFLLAYTPFCRRDGELTALTLTLHPISRFLLEMVRTEPKVFGSPLSIAQIISMGLLAGGILLWIYLRGRRGHAAWPPEAALRLHATSNVAARV